VVGMHNTVFNLQNAHPHARYWEKKSDPQNCAQGLDTLERKEERRRTLSETIDKGEQSMKEHSHPTLGRCA